MTLSRKILVVDDEPAILYLLNEALANIGYSVFLAANANEAFEILKRESISLIFIDLGLEPMNRFELCKKIREDDPEAVIYALVGNTSLLGSHEILEAGFDSYFVKPFTLNELYQVVKEVFEKPEPISN